MNRYFTVVNLILLTITIFFTVEIFYRISTAKLEKGEYIKEKQNVMASYEQEAQYPFANYKPIIDRNLFKTKKEALEKVVKVDVDNLKPTELRLKLLGTVSGDQSKTYAVIEDEKERRQNLYKQGDSVQDATVKMILREKVVLNVNDRDEILEIEKIDTATSSTTSRGGIPRTIQPLSSSRPPSTQRISLNRSMIDEATQDIGKLMTEASIQPYFENGNPEGLRLSRIKMDSIFRKMGLRRGDIITGIDGQSIRSVDDALSLYDRLKSANSVKVEIKRRGQSRILDYNIQ